MVVYNSLTTNIAHSSDRREVLAPLIDKLLSYSFPQNFLHIKARNLFIIRSRFLETVNFISTVLYFY